MTTICLMSVSSIKIRRFRINRRALRILLIALGAWLIVCVLLGIAVFVYGSSDRAQHEDVIIVLGSGLNRDLSPNPATIRRGQRAAELWKAGYAPMLICSGGYATWASRSEADGCAQVLRESGVPADAILLEEQSRSTE